jgi:hypothetical protein
VAIAAAGCMAGIMLAGGTSEVFAPTPPVAAGITHSWPPAPGPEIIRAMLTSVDSPVDQPPTPGPKAIVIIDRPGHDEGPR